MNFPNKSVMFSHLPGNTRAMLLRQGKYVNLRKSRLLCGADAEPEATLFIDEGFIVETLPGSTGVGVAVSVIDRGGLPLAAHLLGRERNTSDWLVTAGTKGLLVPLSILRACFYESDLCRRVILHNVQEQLAEKYRMSACGRLHHATERLATFLLMCANRSSDQRILLSQAQLAAMLGFTRSTIVLTATQLREMGAIRYSRGTIVIADRSLLASQACGCHTLGSIDSPKLLAA
jgi:hypothetical protein